MELFKITPTTAMFLAFFLASCFFVYCDFRLKCLAVLFTGAVFLVLRIGRARIFPKKSDLFRQFLAYILCACTAAGLYSIVNFDIAYGRFKDCAGYSDSVRLRIESCDYSLSYMARYHAVVTDSEMLPSGTRILLTTEHLGMDEGTVLEGSIVYAALSETSSAGFNAERYYLPKRIFLTAEDESLSVTGSETKFSIAGFFREINNQLTVRLIAHTKREYGGTAAAVLLGSREYLNDQTTRDFRRIGVSHLLVVSGTHFSVLLTMLTRMMLHLRMDRRKRAVVSIGVILGFMALTGFSGSVLRAGIMYLIAQIALLADRRVNYLHSLAFAGSAIVLFQPYAAADCGLQLSFTAAYGCLLFNALRMMWYRRRREHRRASGKPLPKYRRPNRAVQILRNVCGTIGLTAVVNILLFPLIWLYFGEISLLSIPANLLFIPLVTGLIYLSGLYLLLYPLHVLTYPLAQCINRYCAFMLDLAEEIAELEHIVIPVNYGFTIFFLVPLTLMLLLIPFVSLRNLQRLTAGILSVFLVFFGVIGVVSIRDRSNVYFSYVTSKAKNDGFALKSDGKLLLCDISDASYGYLNELIAEMAELHSCEVETLVLTHYHNKHVRYVERLCTREVLRSLVLPEPIDEKEDGLYRSLLSTAEREGIAVYTVKSGETYRFGDAEIILHDRMYLSRSTHPITAVSVRACGNLTTLLSCSFNQSHETIAEFAGQSDFLIFGHHSPIYKKTFGLTFDVEPKAVLVSDAALGYMTEDFRGELETMGMFREPAEWCVRIDRNGNYTIIQGLSGTEE